MKTKNKFKVGDYVWFDDLWCPKNHTLGRITKIQVNDTGVQWYRLDNLRGNWASFYTKDEFTPATDSELAWYLVTNEN